MEHKPADGLPHEAIESGGEGYPLGAGGGATLPLALVVRDAASRVALERLTAERAVDDPPEQIRPLPASRLEPGIITHLHLSLPVPLLGDDSGNGECDPLGFRLDPFALRCIRL